MPSYLNPTLKTDVFTRIVRDGDTIAVMTFRRVPELETVLVEIAKATADYAVAKAAHDALPDDERGPDKPAPVPPRTLPAELVPVADDSVAKRLAVATMDDYNPGVLLNGIDIGAAQGTVWQSIQWDRYIHDSSADSAAMAREWVLTSDVQGYVFAPFDRLANRVAGDSGDSDLRRMERSTLLSVAVPFAGASLDDSLVLLYPNAETGFWTNIQAVEMTDKQRADGVWQDVLPLVSISGPEDLASGDAGTLTVTVTVGGKSIAKPVTVVVDADQGYLSRRRMTVVGQGTLSFRALDVEPGTVEIAARIDNAVRTATHTIVVSTPVKAI